MWNPFKKNTQQSDDNNNNVVKDVTIPEDNVKKTDEANSPKMNMLQRLAMKRMEKMSPQEKSKMMQDMLKPENKGKLLSAMEMMKKTGQITEEQYRLAKEKMGL